MFIDRMLNADSEPLLEQWLRFTSERHKLIADNVVNLSTPGYQQKDLSLEKFQAALSEIVDKRESSGASSTDFDSVREGLDETGGGMLFHDGANRSAEQLMTNQAKNAMMHNLAIEILRAQFNQLQEAIRERPS